MMKNVSKRQFSNALFLLIFLMIGVFSWDANAAEEKFDAKYSVKIVRCRGNVIPSLIARDRWRGDLVMYFDNGLYGVSTNYWKKNYTARPVSQMTFLGNANIIPSPIDGQEDENFSVVREKKDYAMRIQLWINKKHKFSGKLPRIRSMTENIETHPYWFMDEIKYRYVVELDNGTTWVTKAQASPRKALWQVGSRIIKIGNSQRPCFINIDAVSGDRDVIREEHYFADLERVN